jgi:hypothetical protein
MAKIDLRNFDPEKVGKLDADMWRAYYNHKFIKLVWRLVLLIKYQLGLNWLLSIRLAYYSGWAAADYRIHKKRGTNNARILRNLTKFYRSISTNNIRPFDYKKAAELELAWWEIHRKSYENNPALEKALADGAAAIYNVDPAKLQTYAHFRAEAMILPRHEGRDPDNQTDWRQVTDLTIKSWRALHAAVQ